MEEKGGGLGGGDGGGQEAETKKPAPVLREILPKCGLVYSEKGNLSEVCMCKSISPESVLSQTDACM